MTKILIGVPLFSLLFLVDARIRICTIEVMANTQQVLAAPAQTGKPLWLHRPSRVTSCPTDFVYRTLWLIPESRLVDRTVYPFRNSSQFFWVNVKVLWLLCQPTFFVSSYILFNCILLLWGICNTTKMVLDRDAVKSVYVE